MTWRRFIFLTLQQNIPLYNFVTLIILFLLVVVPLVFTLRGKISPSIFLLSTLGVGISLFIFHKLKLGVLSRSKSELETEEEKINLLSESIAVKEEILQFLPQTRRKASFLFNVAQGLIELTDREQIHDFIINTLGELFPQADSILFFGFNKERDSLNLLRSLKRKHSVVKEKKGGIIDKWVLHHNRSLLIEDLTKDFRFDANKVEAYKGRGAQSFIVSPLSIDHRLLGIVRGESIESSSFTIDDLRFLRNICDLGTVVLERVNLFASAQDLAIKDSLTTLYLREYFFNRLEEELNRAQNKGSKIGVIMLDIDDFKKVNDDYGHIVGDFVLKKLAKILIDIAGGAGNLISRFGGEEFIISIPECNKKELLHTAEEIRRRIEGVGLTFRRKKINFTVSLGATLAFDKGENIKKLTQKVDKLLYKAKKEGKNRLCFSE